MIFKAKKNYKKHWLCPRCGFESGKRNMNNHFNSDPPCEAFYLDITYEEIAKDYDTYYEQCVTMMEAEAQIEPSHVQEPQEQHVHTENCSHSQEQQPPTQQQQEEEEEDYEDPLSGYYARIPRSILKAMTMDSIRGLDKQRLMNETKRIMDREYRVGDDRDFVTMPMSLLRVILLESLPHVCRLRMTDDPAFDWNWIITPFLVGSESSYIPYLRSLATLDSVTQSLTDVQEKANFLERVVALHFFKFGGLPGAPGAGDNPGANNNNNNNNNGNNNTISFSQSNRTRNGVPVED